MALIYPVTFSTARFSEDRAHRYDLIRQWAGERTLACIGLNPSTADEEKNDPTVFGMILRAQQWGFGRFVMLNLFGRRSAYPRDLLLPGDPIGPRTDEWIDHWARRAEVVVCAWGAGGAAKDLVPKRQQEVIRILRAAGVPTKCFKLNKDGTPIHPLYQKHSADLIQY